MIQLVYISHQTIELKQEDIDKITATARSFNASQNITGCLLHHKGQFIQLLEGPGEHVINLFNKISQDKRHTDVFILRNEKVNRRYFDDWEMAFHNIHDEDLFSIGRQLLNKKIKVISEFREDPTFSMEIFWTYAKSLLHKKQLKN